MGSLACDAYTSGSGGLTFGVGGLCVGLGIACGLWSLCPPPVMSTFLLFFIVKSHQVQQVANLKQSKVFHSLEMSPYIAQVSNLSSVNNGDKNISRSSE